LPKALHKIIACDNETWLAKPSNWRKMAKLMLNDREEFDDIYICRNMAKLNYNDREELDNIHIYRIMAKIMTTLLPKLLNVGWTLVYACTASVVMLQIIYDRLNDNLLLLIQTKTINIAFLALPKQNLPDDRQPAIQLKFMGGDIVPRNRQVCITI
jgi:hypothetical protein